MATRKTPGSSRTGSARTGSKNAGKPSDGSTARKRAAAAAPSAEELDLRDRLKAGPRRPAGPPLVGDTPTRAAMDALRTEVLPEPTDPKNRGSGGAARKGRNGGTGGTGSNNTEGG